MLSPTAMSATQASPPLIRQPGFGSRCNVGNYPTSCSWFVSSTLWAGSGPAPETTNKVQSRRETLRLSGSLPSKTWRCRVLWTPPEVSNNTNSVPRSPICRKPLNEAGPHQTEKQRTGWALRMHTVTRHVPVGSRLDHLADRRRELTYLYQE